MKERRVALATETGAVAAHSISMEGGRIAALEDAAEPEAGLLAAPGFVDLQINGGWGHDFTSEPESIWDVAGRLPAHGVTAFLPTLVSAPDRAYERALAVLRSGPPPGYAGARPLGLHAEGPFLAPPRRGAHDARHLRVPADGLPGWLDAPELRMVTVAPELDGAIPLIEKLAARGVLVALGHSDCDDATARRAVDAGARYGTHLFNAMSGVHHREPGLAAALLRDGRAVCGIIADGVHLHPAIVDLTLRAKGARGLSLVSDAVAAAGMPDGQYALGDQEVHVRDGAVRLADGTLAGSALTLDQAVRNLAAFTGCALAEAVKPVTATPAALLGGDHGRLRPGGPADVTVLGPGGRVSECWVAGARVH